MKHREVILGYVTVIWALSVLVLAGGDILSGVGSQAVMGNVIGVSAGVAPNEFNTLIAQLSDREKELDARSAALSSREQSIVSELDARQKDRMNTAYTYLFGFTLLLFLLVCVNYYLDYHRQPRVV
jgi:ABC-type Na+ efflux pump permease subunit